MEDKALANFDPNKMASFRGDEDPASPTTIIFKQMQAAGIPLNAGNIQRFVASLGRQPNEAGPDIGSAGPPDRNLQVQRTDGDSNGKSVAGKIEGGTSSQPSKGAQSLPDREPSRPPGVGSPDTSSQPTSTAQAGIPGDPMTGGLPPGYQAGDAGGDSSWPLSGGLGKAGLGAAILAGAQAVPGMLGRLFPGVGSGLGTAIPADPSLALAGPAAVPQLTDQSAIRMPDATSGPTISLGQAAPPGQDISPMESAMQKAIAPQEMPQLGGPPSRLALPAPGERPPIPLPDATSGPTIEAGAPRGLNLTGATGGGQGPGGPGPLTPAMIREGQIKEGMIAPPQINFPSRAGRVGRIGRVGPIGVR